MTDTQSPSITEYVLMVVVDPAAKQVISLLKGKGPAHLIGKLTFPGGKLEAGELIEAAASRELAEETGVEIDPSLWTVFSTDFGPYHKVTSVVATSSAVHTARPLEAESVYVMNLDTGIQDFIANGHRYVSDFGFLLAGALRACAAYDSEIQPLLETLEAALSN